MTSTRGHAPPLSSLYNLTDYYADYYGNDEDVLDPGPGIGAIATDATFQCDPEHYWFSCLSEEETWNYLDMQVKATAKELKVCSYSWNIEGGSQLGCVGRRSGSLNLSPVLRRIPLLYEAFSTTSTGIRWRQREGTSLPLPL